MATVSERLRAVGGQLAHQESEMAKMVSAELLALAEIVEAQAKRARKAVDDCPYDDDLAVYDACCTIAAALAPEPPDA